MPSMARILNTPKIKSKHIKLAATAGAYGTIDLSIKTFGTYEKRALNVWRSVVGRCVPGSAERLRHTTYDGCKLHKSWRKFSKFLEWYRANYIEGYDLDKDILTGKSKVYGPHTCCFVPHYINTLVRGRMRKGKTLPEGVNLCKQLNAPYRAVICKYGKQEHIGYYSSVSKAVRAYRAEKSKHISCVAYWAYELGHINEEVYANLRIFARDFLVAER